MIFSPAPVTEALPWVLGIFAAVVATFILWISKDDE